MTLIRKEKSSQLTREQRIEHQRWCNKNGITIYFEPIDFRMGKIIINDNELIEKSEEVYLQPIKKKGKIQAWKKNEPKYWNEVLKLYTKIYKEKNNGLH